MLRNKWRIAKIAVGIVILVLLVIQVSVQEIIRVMSSFNVIFILPILALHIAALMLGAMNIQVLLHGISKKIGFSEMLKKYLLSSVIGAITPGRLGEFSLVYFLKKNNIPIGVSAAIILLDKILTILTLIAFSVWGLFIFFSGQVALEVLAVSIGGLGVMWFICISETGKNLVKRFMLKSLNDSFNGFSKTLSELVRKKKKYVIGNIIITIMKWLLHFVLFYITFLAFEVTLPISSLLLFATVMLIAYIPVTFGGLGLREVAAVYIFKFIGIEPEVVVSVFLLILIVKYLSNFGIMMYLTKEK